MCGVTQHDDIGSSFSLDGRYAEATTPLTDFFSQFAFLRDRNCVELDFLSALSKTDLIHPLIDSEFSQLESIKSNFSLDDAERFWSTNARRVMT